MHAPNQLWLGYQRMLDTARVLIKPDRTGSWDNHLHVVFDALQYLLQQDNTTT